MGSFVDSLFKAEESGEGLENVVFSRDSDPCALYRHALIATQEYTIEDFIKGSKVLFPQL